MPASAQRRSLIARGPRALGAEGAAMTLDEAVAYALERRWQRRAPSRCSPPMTREPVDAPDRSLVDDRSQTADRGCRSGCDAHVRQLRRAAMDERKCKLICRCGYFLSCSDYYCGLRPAAAVSTRPPAATTRATGAGISTTWRRS